MSATQTKPRSASGGVLKRLLVGRAMSSHKLEHTLLPKILALPVFSSDALSSVAYATGEILLVLLFASTAGQELVMPISIAIATLMAIVVISYRQTVRAYPSGGGAYIVSKDNLGVLPGLIAAAALLVDYMMTVIVSIVAGVFAIVSAVPSLSPHRVALSIGFVIFMMLANLRGVRESGTLFAVPTYGFIVAILAMIAIGLLRCTGGCPPVYEEAVPVPGLATTAAAVGLWSILRAFSSGATALTGVEAISNGVPAFRRPQARNAAETLAMMGVIAITMFLGISWLATHIAGVTASDETSVVAQIAMTVFDKGLMFYVVQAFTAAILVLAANTAYQDFPRLSAILARDRFMPRQFVNRGDRLVFSNGVIVLSVLSCVMIYAFDADLNRLIQLYVVGVFTSFTLSQTGMVRHWLKEKHKGTEAEKGWKRSIVINIIGAITTGIVLVVTISAKFTHGAWLSILMMAAIVPTLLSIHRHYTTIREELSRGRVTVGGTGLNHVVLIVDQIDDAMAEAVGYIRATRPTDLRAVYPTNGSVPVELQERWRRFAVGAADLEPLPLPGGSLLEGVREYVRQIPRRRRDFITVVVPEVVRDERLTAYLVRRRALVRLKAGILREPNVVVADVPVLAGSTVAVGAGGRALIPRRTVALVFVAAVNDAAVRAVNYAQTLGVDEVRAIHFDLDPDETHGLGDQWAQTGMGIPLDIVEAPFRDLTEPMLDEVRSFTDSPDTLAVVVIPELILPKRRHLLLHNQSALFVKRLMLFEPRVVLAAVPFSVGMAE